MDIKTIILEKINRILNPTIERILIKSLLFSGLSFFVAQVAIKIFIAGRVETQNAELKFLVVISESNSPFYIGLVLIVLSIFIYVFGKLQNKEVKNNFKSLKKAAPTIYALLSENRRVFLAFGPNSSASHIKELKTDIELWKLQRAAVILVNNRTIKGLLTNFKQFSSLHEKSICESMINHIEAFEAHCNNPDITYSQKHQFPAKFSNLIDTYCSARTGRKSKSKIQEFSKWILLAFKDNGLSFSESFLFGSIVCGVLSSDVDLLLYHTESRHEAIQQISQAFKNVSSRFEKKFDQRLHIQCFCAREEKEYHLFKETCGNTLKFGE